MAVNHYLLRIIGSNCSPAKIINIPPIITWMVIPGTNAIPVTDANTLGANSTNPEINAKNMNKKFSIAFCPAILSSPPPPNKKYNNNKK